MKYVIVDSRDKDFRKEFNSKNACYHWLFRGMLACEGAERDHYVSMLGELAAGHKVLHYN